MKNPKLGAEARRNLTRLALFWKTIAPRSHAEESAFIGARHMFIGHYGVSLAAKRYESRISLGILFLAVQFLDILFAILVLLNVEHLRIVPGFTKFNPYDLYYMPYSHSFLGALLWSVLVALIYWWVVRAWDSGSKGAALIGFAVFSHFLLDLPMHVHDMPLLMSESSTKFGLGLWNHRNLSLLAEAVCFFDGAFLYLRSTQAVSKFGQAITATVFLVLSAMLFLTPFMPPPANSRAFAFQALGSYLLLALLAECVDRVRQPAN